MNPCPWKTKNRGDSSLRQGGFLRQSGLDFSSNSRRVRPESNETGADACGEGSGTSRLSPPGGAAETVGCW